MEEDAFSFAEKKRKLRIDQVKSLEKNFEEENKLEPERKVRIAEETGLHPRQVAVWFQNRRARGKTKQLERDYEVLKAHYDSLKLDYGNLQHERQILTSELKELRAKVREESNEEEQSISLAEQMVPTCQNGHCSSSCSGSESAKPCPFGSYPQKDINMVELEELCNLNSLEYGPLGYIF